MSDTVVGTDVERIKTEYGEDFLEELECADDWDVIEDKLSHESRWCTHWRMVLRHNSNMFIAVDYARDIGDGESASVYETTWYEVEPREKTIIEYVAK